MLVDAAGGFGEGLEQEQGEAGRRAAWRRRAAVQSQKVQLLTAKSSRKDSKAPAVQLLGRMQVPGSSSSAFPEPFQVGLRRLRWAEVSHGVLLPCSPCCPSTLILHHRQTLHFHTNKLWAWKRAKTNSGIGNKRG